MTLASLSSLTMSSSENRPHAAKIGSGRHQGGRSDHSVEILHRKRRRRSGRHRDVGFHRRVDVETAGPGLANLALDGLDHIGAGSGVRR